MPCIVPRRFLIHPIHSGSVDPSRSRHRQSPEELLAPVAPQRPHEHFREFRFARTPADRLRQDAAHRVAQEIPGRSGAWVHAYLHRKEGDLGNAAYWYRAAEKAREDAPLADEWMTIAGELLGE